MLRTTGAFIGLALCSVASAQGIVSPYVPPPFIPIPSTGPIVGVSGVHGRVRVGGLYLGGYSTYSSPYYFPNYAVPNLTYFGNGYGYGIPSYPLPAPTPILPPPPLPSLVPPSAISKDIADAEFTAWLGLIFPAPANVWMDDKPVTDSTTNVVSLTSSPLKVGASHTFKIRATWSVDGKKYGIDRSVTVKAGDRSRLIIVSGDEVK